MSAETEYRAQTGTTNLTLPLTGYRVVELGQYIAIPGAAQILVDQGATVIKVEPPGGESCRRLPGMGEAMFSAYNRGKRMVELDIAEAEGNGQLLDLLRDADVVLSNIKPGALDRYGLSVARMQEVNPKLIVLTLTGFGDTGEMSRRPGLDIAAQAESGIMWVTGAGDGEPQRVGFPVVDSVSATTAAQAATAALLHRERTGAGTHIRLSLWDVAIHLQATNWMDWFLTGSEPVRKGNGQPTAAPAADVIEVQDGYVVVSAYMPHQWSALCNALERPDLIDDSRYRTSTDRVVHRDALHADLAAALVHLSQTETVERLSAAGVVAGSVRDYPGAYRARMEVGGSLFVDGMFEGRQMPYIGTPLEWEGAAPVSAQPRALGADNDLLQLPAHEMWYAAATNIERGGK